MTERSAVVLAGGHSRRFGRMDKALAELNGDPLLTRVVDRVSTVVDDVVVSCRPGQVRRFERPLSSVPEAEIIEDSHPGAGPLAGIEAGLDAVFGTYTAVVACDMPLVEPAVIEELFRYAAGTDAAVPEDADGNLQPVQAVYQTEAMRTVATQMLPDDASLHAALDALSVVTVPSETIPDGSLHNVNTRQDLTAAKRRRHESDWKTNEG